MDQQPTEIMATSKTSNLRKFFANNKLLTFYSFWLVSLTCAYFWVLYSGNRPMLPFVWAAIGLSGIVAMIIGLLKYRPKAWLGWVALILANTLFISGDTYFKVLHYILNIGNPFPSFADALYLTTYPLFALGFIIFVRKHSSSKTDKGVILDASIFSVGMAMLIWVYLVIPNSSADASLAARITSIAYPIGDVLVWTMLVRLLLIDFRTRAIQLLGIGALGLITADIVYGLGQFYGFWHEGNPVDLGWIIFYGAWGAAALHKSMLSIDTPLTQTGSIRLRRLVLLALTALIAPGILYAETLQGNSAKVSGVIAMFAAILFVLVVMRMFTLVKEISRRDSEIALEKQKHELIGLVSHQLRTPITIIGLASEELANQTNEAFKIKLITNIRSANQRLAELTNTLIFSSQLDLGTITFKPVPQKLSQLVVLELADAQALITENGVKVVFHQPQNEPDSQVDSDAMRASIGYLISNAVHYSKQENKNIEITMNYTNNFVELAVKDNGVGIPEADQPAIFTKLFRASNAITSFPDGLGISLYLAKSIVDKHQGTIGFSSKLNEGSTFYIKLPLGNLEP